MLSLRGQFSGRRTNFRRGRGIGLKTSRNDLKSYKPKLSGGFRGGNRRRGGNFRLLDQYCKKVYFIKN